jgi:hypothetical protein
LEEHALFAELLRVDRVALVNFMAYAARTLRRARIQLQRRTHEPKQFLDKLNRLRRLYARLLRRAAALRLPSVAKLLENTVAALDAPRSSEARTGDALLPALVCIDAVFLALMTVASTRASLSVRRARSRSRLAECMRHLSARPTTAPTSQLAVALQQLAISWRTRRASSFSSPPWP